MDFGLAFSYVFKDRDWLKKISILALVSLIPILGQIVVYGWMMNIAKRVMNHDPAPLPDLDFGNDLSRGFMGFIISIVYALPMLIIYGIIFIIGMSGSYTEYSQAADFTFALVSFCGVLFMVAYGLFMALIIPAAYTRYLDSGALSAAFDFNAVFKQVRLNIGTYLFVMLGAFLAGLIASAGLIACIIGVMWTYAYSMAVLGHLYGQAHNEANKSPMIVEVPPAS